MVRRKPLDVAREEAIRRGKGGSHYAWRGRKPLGVARKEAIMRGEGGSH